MSNSVLVRIQHHPSRASLIPSLLQALAPLPTEVSTHESIPPNPWLGYRQCLSNVPECSHLLIVQDDAQPCRNFAAAIEKVAERLPNTPVCLFLGAAPADTAVRARRASVKGNLYVPLGPSSFMPLVAVLWPREKAQDFLGWADFSRRVTRADDGNAARWMKANKEQVMVTVPSLVQHNDFIPSVKGGRDHAFGKESWRQAVLLAEDGLDYEW